MTERRKGDERFKPLRLHIEKAWLASYGYKIVTDASDWVQVARMLSSAPSITLEQFTDSYDGYLRARRVDQFYQRQKAVRAWACNPTPWLRPVSREPATKPEVVRASEQECQLWAQAAGTLAQRIGARAYDIWIRPLVPVRFGSSVVVAAPSHAFRAWLMDNYSDQLRAAVGRDVEVVVE